MFMDDFSKNTNSELLEMIKVLSKNHDIIKDEILRLMNALEDVDEGILPIITDDIVKLAEILKQVDIDYLNITNELKKRI